MFLRVRLRNWRSIESAIVTLAPFTVIVGPNSSGKSNFVDALLFASEIGRDAAHAVARRGGIEAIRRWSRSKPYDVTVERRAAEKSDDLESRYQRHEFVLHSGREGLWTFQREVVENRLAEKLSEQTVLTRDAARANVPNGLPRGFPDTSSALLFARQFGQLRAPRRLGGLLPEAWALRPAPERMRVPQPLTESFKLSETADNIATTIHRMKRDAREQIVNVMTQVVPDLRDVKTTVNGRYASLVFTQARSGGDAEFQATEMSDGALRALAVITAAHGPWPRRGAEGPELLIIEEPEVNVHPGVARVLYDVLREASKSRMVLLTTHSPELLEHAKDDDILVCEYVNGVTQIGPLANAQRRLVRDGLFSTAELMRTEPLRREGARPQVVVDA